MVQRKTWFRLIGTLIALIVLALVGFKTYYHFEQKEIKKVVTETLTFIQTKEYTKAKKNFVSHKQSWDTLEQKRLKEISDLLQNSFWEVKYIYYDTFDVIVLVYFNEEVGSIPGQFEQVTLFDDNGKWSILFQPRTLFRLEKNEAVGF